ncbi:MAG: dihydropteroate synthase, partial [Candidatus Poseidoniia archaeon]|nr:dihydropteroate synthase [Candidatus Poseidoniia archaeon]
MSLKLDGKCHVMGILNVTPDSFYDNFFDTVSIQNRIKEIVAEGAEIIDIGGESTRPGSKPVSAEEELERVIPAIEFVKSISDIPVSI